MSKSEKENTTNKKTIRKDGFNIAGILLLAFFGMVILALSLPIEIEGKAEVSLDNGLYVDGEGSILNTLEVERNSSTRNVPDINSSILVDYTGDNFISVEYKVKAPTWVWIYVLELT